MSTRTRTRKFNTKNTNSKLEGFFNDQMRRVHLYLELASVVDWGEHFIKATYNLILRVIVVFDMLVWE